MESTFHILKVTPDGPLTQMCTMKCHAAEAQLPRRSLKNNLSVNVVVGNCDSSRDMLYVA